jgi:hypothetical protein
MGRRLSTSAEIVQDTPGKFIMRYFALLLFLLASSIHVANAQLVDWTVMFVDGTRAEHLRIDSLHDDTLMITSGSVRCAIPIDSIAGLRRPDGSYWRFGLVSGLITGGVIGAYLTESYFPYGDFKALITYASAAAGMMIGGLTGALIGLSVSDDEAYDFNDMYPALKRATIATILNEHRALER